MKKFYFTFGVGSTRDTGMMYSGGHVLVYAETMRESQEKFKKRFPHPKENTNPYILNCAFFYTEEEFKPKTGTFYGNMYECREVIE